MKFKIENVQAQPVCTHTLTESVRGKLRNKLTVLDVAGKTWKEKRDMIYELLIHDFGEIPEGVSFMRRKTNAKDKKNNPDGLRILVYCTWIKRNRFYDENGKFNYGTVVKAVNKQIIGFTKKHILA